MSILAFVICLLFFKEISGHMSVVRILTERIHDQQSIQTIYFIGNPSENEAFLEELALPRLIYNPDLKHITKDIEFDKNVLLLVMVQGKDIPTQALKDLIETIMRRQYIIIYSQSLDELQKYFSWFWRNKFTRIFGATNRTSYAYLPYADLKMQVLEDDKPLPDAFRDLNGYEIRTTVETDPPRVFPYTDRKGNRKIGGSTAQLFFGFLQKHNASYRKVTLINMTGSFLPRFKDALYNEELDLSMNVYVSTPGLKMSYPLKVMTFDIIAPYNGYVPANEYFVRPYKTSTWIAIVLSGTYITFMGILCNYYIDGKLNIWETCSQVYSIGLGLSSESRIKKFYRFYILVLLFWFIITSIYNIYLTSFLTVFIKSKQFDTLEDLVNNNISVLAGYYERSYILETFNLPKKFEKILTGVHPSNIINVWNEIPTFAYTSSGERTEFYLTQQVYLRQPRFHVCTEYLGKMFMGFLLHPRSEFIDPSATYVIEVLQSGLLEKWTSDTIYQGREAGILKTLRDEGKPFAPLRLYHLTFAWNCFLIGLSTSFCVFTVEIFLDWILQYKK